MCSNPQTINGNEFACRSCNACLATRRRQWVARALMETATNRYGLVVALTYDEDTQANRDAARFFCYADARSFIQRLTAAVRRIDPSHYVRFACAGEQGSRFNRVHWHLILWSSVDLRTLGEVSRFGRPVTDLDAMLTVGKIKKRLHWSMWADDGRPKGFVTMQELNEASASYVLSYCLKDQFTSAKSVGTMREHKGENFATGLFRMSKRPSIGAEWLERKLEGLRATGAVLPSLNLTVPGLSGHYQPSGPFRVRLLEGLRDLNQFARDTTGKDAPQWRGLLQSCEAFPSDLEVLHGEQEATGQNELPPEEAIRYREIDRAFKERDRRAAFLRQWIITCQKCIRYPSRFWTWNTRGKLRFHPPSSPIAYQDGWYEFVGNNGETALFGSQVEARCPDARCETCGGKSRIVAFPRPVSDPSNTHH